MFNISLIENSCLSKDKILGVFRNTHEATARSIAIALSKAAPPDVEIIIGVTKESLVVKDMYKVYEFDNNGDPQEVGFFYDFETAIDITRISFNRGVLYVFPCNQPERKVNMSKFVQVFNGERVEVTAVPCEKDMVIRKPGEDDVYHRWDRSHIDENGWCAIPATIRAVAFGEQCPALGLVDDSVRDAINAAGCFRHMVIDIDGHGWIYL